MNAVATKLTLTVDEEVIKAAKADSLVGDLLKLVRISPVDTKMVVDAYESAISCFEDALQHFSARHIYNHN